MVTVPLVPKLDPLNVTTLPPAVEPPVGASELITGAS